MMMRKSVIWWRKPEYPEETTDLRQVTDETFHTYGLCPVRGLNLGRSGVKQSELRRDESGALAHRATAVPPDEGVTKESLMKALQRKVSNLTRWPRVDRPRLKPHWYSEMRCSLSSVQRRQSLTILSMVLQMQLVKAIGR